MTAFEIGVRNPQVRVFRNSVGDEAIEIRTTVDMPPVRRQLSLLDGRVAARADERNLRSRCIEYRISWKVVIRPNRASRRGRHHGDSRRLGEARQDAPHHSHDTRLESEAATPG